MFSQALPFLPQGGAGIRIWLFASCRIGCGGTLSAPLVCSGVVNDAPSGRSKTMQKLVQPQGEVLPNIGEVERLATALGGGLLIALGLRQGRRGIPLAILGGVLVVRGASGQSLTYRSLGVSSAGGESVEITRAVTIDADQGELYRLWRNVEGLPRFMPQLEQVSSLDERRWRWVAKAPGGASIAGEAEIIEEEEPWLIAWRALPDQVQTWSTGRVELRPAPGGRGTEVRVRLEYQAPAGGLGRLVTSVAAQAPAQQAGDSLRRLKMWLEAGEVATGAMRREDDWEQGRQPWQRGDDRMGPGHSKEVGA
jgi:uncharacterized membrane protein